LINGLRVLGD